MDKIFSDKKKMIATDDLLVLPATLFCCSKLPNCPTSCHWVAVKTAAP